MKLRCLVVSAVSLFLFEFLYFAPFGSPHSDTTVLASFRSSFFCDANDLISPGCEGNCMELFGNNKTTLQVYNSEHRNGLSFSIISSFRSHYASYFVVWRVPGLTGRRTKCRYEAINMVDLDRAAVEPGLSVCGIPFRRTQNISLN